MLCSNMLTKTGWLFFLSFPPFFYSVWVSYTPSCSCMKICLALLHFHSTPLSFLSSSVSSLHDATLLRLRLRLHNRRVKPHRLLLNLFSRRTKARSAAHRLLIDVHLRLPCPRLRILNLLLDSCSPATHMSIKPSQVARRSSNDLHDLRGGDFAR